jgi:nucleoside-diphosphate-sugar epimerase
VKTASIRDIAELVAFHTKSQLVIPSIDANHKIYGQDTVRLDISAYTEDFGLPVFTELDYGLSQTIEWQKLNLYKNTVKGR